MGARNNCIVWIHGISETLPGYSNVWSDALDPYLQASGQNQSYSEVLWSDIFGESQGVPNPAERLISTVFSRILPADISDILLDPDAYVNELMLYLTRPAIRAAVNQKLKVSLLALLNDSNTLSIIAHSLGSVIAYETLQELVVERPGLRLTNLFTLGSPLRYLKLFLGHHPGPRPANTTTWVNIYAQGDLIASSLSPDFAVSPGQDHHVPNFGSQAHMSYFEDGNVAVLRDIIATTIINS